MHRSLTACRLPPLAPLLLLFVASLLFVPPAGAEPGAKGDWSVEAWLERQSGWEGFGVGTMVRTRMTKSTSGTEATHVVDVEESLIKATDDAFTLRVVTSMRGRRAAPLEQQLLRAVPGGKLTLTELTAAEDASQDSPKARVLVEGVPYPCRRVRATRMIDEIEERTVLWVNETLGVLRSETHYGTQRLTMVTRRLEAELRVGGQAIACREIDLQSGGGKGTLHVSPEVPGRVLRQTMEIDQGSVRHTLTREMTAFTKR